MPLELYRRPPGLSLTSSCCFVLMAGGFTVSFESACQTSHLPIAETVRTRAGSCETVPLDWLPKQKLVLISSLSIHHFIFRRPHLQFFAGSGLACFFVFSAPLPLIPYSITLDLPLFGPITGTFPCPFHILEVPSIFFSEPAYPSDSHGSFLCHPGASQFHLCPGTCSSLEGRTSKPPFAYRTSTIPTSWNLV